MNVRAPQVEAPPRIEHASRREQVFPFEPILTRTPSGRSTAIFLAKLMDEPRNRPQTPPLGANTGWALKLKQCIDVVARELRVEVLSAKPLQVFDSADSRDMLFEVITNRGRLEVARDRNGQHTFNWPQVQSA